MQLRFAWPYKKSPHPTINFSFDPEPRACVRYCCVMRPLRYSINVNLEGCCDHRAIPADEDVHRHAAENLDK